MSKILRRYTQLVEQESITSDPEQLKLIRSLERLCSAIDYLHKKMLFRKKGIYIQGGIGTGKSMIMRLFFYSFKVSQEIQNALL